MTHRATLLFMELLLGLFLDPRFPKLNKSETRIAMDSIARDIYDELEFLTKSKSIKAIMKRYRGTDMSRRDCCLFILGKFKHSASLEALLYKE